MTVKIHSVDSRTTALRLVMPHCVHSLMVLAPSAKKNILSLKKVNFFHSIFQPELSQQGSGKAKGIKNLQTPYDYAKERKALIAVEKNIKMIWFHTRIMTNETALKRAEQRMIFY